MPEYSRAARALITKDQLRELYLQEFKPGSYFGPSVDKDGNFYISVWEIEQCIPEVLKKFPWIVELEVKEPEQIFKTFATKKEWLEYDKAQYEKEAQRVSAELEVIDTKPEQDPKDPIDQEIKK